MVSSTTHANTHNGREANRTGGKGRKRGWFRAIIIGLNLVVCVVLFSSAYGGMIDPRVSPIPALLTLMLPVAIATSILAIVADLLIYRKLALLPGITLLLCAGPVWDFSPVNVHTSKDPDDATKTFTFMTFNAWGYMNYSRRNEKSTLTEYQLRWAVKNNELSCATVSYILNQRADVVCLQEATQRGINQWNLMNRQQLDSINLLYPHYIHAPFECLMSVYPMKPVDLRQTGDPTATFQAGEITIHGLPILFVSVHLQSIGLNDGDKELFRNIAHVNSKTEIKAVKEQLVHKLSEAFRKRADQAELLAQQLDSLGYENVIIGGDFNDVPSCYAIRSFEKQGYRTVYSTLGRGPMATYHASRFYFQIDHILYKGKVEPVGFRRGNVKLSDHYPLFATFEVTE